MKNAYVLEHHFGDDGNVAEGQILTDVSEKRFHALEKLGIIREATDDEVKTGTVIPFVTHEELQSAVPAPISFADAERLRNALEDRYVEIEGLRREIGELQKGFDERQSNLTTHVEDLGRELQAAADRQEKLEQDLADANTRADTAEGKVREMEEKASQPAADKRAQESKNKSAPTPPNKAAE